MVMSVGLRTIWVGIRAYNYTDQAFKQVGKNVDELIKKQQELKDKARFMLMAGTLWLAGAAMITMGIMRIIQKSSEGSQFMDRFNQKIEQSLSRLANAMLKVWGPILNAFSSFFELIASNPALGTLISVLSVLIIVLMATKGITMILTGAFDTLMITMTSMGVVSVGTSMKMAMGFNMVKASLGPILIMFTLAYTIITALKDNIGLIGASIIAIIPALAIMAAMLWSGATAMSVLTFGVAAAVGIGAAIAAAAMTPTPSYQAGTRMVTRTGPAFMHRGEVIYNPSRGLPTQTAREAEQKSTSLHQEVKIDMSGSTIQTKMDKEELMPAIKRELRKTVLSKE